MNVNTRTGILILLAFSMALAGCTGASSKGQTNQPSQRTVATAGSFDNVDPEDAGEIVGRVVDDEFRPLGDVTVRLQGTPAETQTTQDGIFYFSQVPARGYTIQYAKPGYATKNQSIVVAAKQRVVAEA
ncbi:MAG TPA: carboxypeptidase-like regulatory domain-containing protein, partial [Candidatus Thermoplasmatota archaeon]|nr:carboxypeptidase-like regulatory domain-containing protein [Candidatus Thermoplasmatota archaeon]